jgi:hypothetical protein
MGIAPSSSTAALEQRAPESMPHTSGQGSGTADRLVLEFANSCIADLDSRSGVIKALHEGRPVTPTHLAELRDAWPTFIKLGPNPMLSWQERTTICKTQDGKSTMLINPEYFKLPTTQVVFWAPHIFFGEKPCCPLCKSNKRVVAHGWQKNYARRIAGTFHTIWAMCYRYKCKICPGEAQFWLIGMPVAQRLLRLFVTLKSLCLMQTSCNYFHGSILLTKR